MDKIALIIIYNHQYNENIAVLEEIYRNRFSNIFHLVPFYTGTNPRVISVYESSFYFQGYVSQGLNFFFNDKYEHYFFIADDLLLNPSINEQNYTQYFRLGPNTCFIPELISFHQAPLSKPWERVADAFYFNNGTPGAETTDHFPSYEAAANAMKKFKLTIEPLRFEQIWQRPHTFKDYLNMPFRELLRYWKGVVLKQKHHLKYPLVGGYADIFIISADAIKNFSHYCGVSAVMQLFVEVAIPTNVVLAAKDIVTEKDLMLKGLTEFNGSYLLAIEKYNGELSKLLNDFPANLLYIHPIKLSRWKK